MSFPALFFGYDQLDDVFHHFSYHKIDQWELLHKDDDFATHITNLFFKAITINLYNKSLVVLGFVYVKVN